MVAIVQEGGRCKVELESDGGRYRCGWPASELGFVVFKFQDEPTVGQAQSHRIRSIGLPAYLPT